VHSPAVQKVVVRRTGRVRRSRLYYLRERTGKATRLREVLDLKRPGAAEGARPAVAEPPVPAAVVPEPEPTAAAE
jgi:large subunit ribosomal protein L19